MHSAPDHMRERIQAILDTGETGDFILWRMLYDLVHPPAADINEEDLTQPLEHLIRPDAPSSKYTPEIVGKVLEGLHAGMAHTHAAGHAGISRDTFYEWYYDTRKAIFRRLVDNARSANVLANLANIQNHSKSHWVASAWLLERVSPEEYGQRQVVQQQISGPNGGPVQITATKLEEAAGDVAEFRKKMQREFEDEERRRRLLETNIIDVEPAEREPWRP